MIDKVQKIRKEVARIQLYTQSEVLKQVLDYIDEVQKEPVSELWHDSNKEQPKAESDVAIWDGESGEILTRCVKVNPNRKWAYMEDMLNKKEEPVSEDYRERYKNITRSDAFKSAYENKSLGEVMSVEGEESVSEDLEKAAKDYVTKEAAKDIGGDWTTVDILNAFNAGAKWQKEKDESKTEDLGEYINELSKQFPEVSFAKLSRIAVRVAKWQEQQFEKNRLAACDRQTEEEAEIEQSFVMGIIENEHRQPTFDDAIKYGMRLREQQMMAKAVDVEVKMDAGGYPYIPQMELYDYDKDEPLAKEGDKYKVVFKED